MTFYQNNKKGFGGIGMKRSLPAARQLDSNPVTRHFMGLMLLLMFSILLSACGGGASTTSNSNTNTPQVVSYNGPVAATEDVLSFQQNFWENLRADNRCGSCHGNGQDPEFVREDDVNLAYAAAITRVDFVSPQDSLIVTKVGGGHQCWLSSDAACADIITAYIQNWIAGSGGVVSQKKIQLSAPIEVDPGDSKTFPSDSSGFASTVHPLLTAHCSGCHAETAPVPQAPFFANADPDLAYEAVRTSQKIDLDTPSNSRLVVRLRQEFHNCWSNNCQNDATEMENAIIAFANGIPLVQIDQQLIYSKALKLGDGIVATGGARHEANLIALYEFKTGNGTTAFDTSGVEPSLNLGLSGNYEWVNGYGVDFKGPDAKAQGTTSSSKKLHDFIKSSGEYSIEAWVIPGNVSQEGPARIISYSGGPDPDVRNFTMGQTLYNYNFLQSSSTTNNTNGLLSMNTNDNDRDLQASLQHVVMTYDQINGRRIYVNGVWTDDTDPAQPGNLNNWDDSFAFVLGNEVSGDRPWLGKLRMVAIHNRSLTQEQITQNFNAGVGEKYFLLFSIGDHVGLNQTYVMLEVSEFDNYSYLMTKPTFISLDPNVSPSSIPVRGMRIGINGKEASVGQVFANMDFTVNSQNYTIDGALLSDQGAVIASEKGAANDEFFLTFEVLGNNTNIKVEASPLQPPAPADQPAVSDIGLKTFAEIDASMSVMTDVARTESNVQTAFNTLKQQLPTVESIEGFLSSQQMAISQLAIEYCNALVDDDTLRPTYFSDFETNVGFSTGSATAFDTATKRGYVINALINRMMGTGQDSQPLVADVTTELDSLMVGLSPCPGCSGAQAQARTRTVVKATCSAMLGSAVTLVQ